MLYILYGATGDLARKKIIPSLFELFAENFFSESQLVVYALSRREWSGKEYRDFIRPDLEKYISAHVPHHARSLDAFLNTIFFRQYDFEHENGREQADSIAQEIVRVKKTNVTTYLSIAQHHMHTVIDHWNTSASWKSIWADQKNIALIEKPFGTSEQNAQLLEHDLLSVMSDSQIYRIDHYLAKHQVRQLSLIASTQGWHDVWNAIGVREVRVVLNEKKDIDGRGAFYDTTGALKDTGQNHALAVLASVFPKDEQTPDRASVLKRYVDTLSNAKHMQEVDDWVFGQYEGYLETVGVAPDSQTETFYRIQLSDKNNIGMRIEGGKALPEDGVYIWVLGPDIHHFARIDIQPHVGINVSDDVVAKLSELGKQAVAQLTPIVRSEEAYVSLLRAAYEGKISLFASLDEIIYSWMLVDTFLRTRKERNIPLVIYKKGEGVE